MATASRPDGQRDAHAGDLELARAAASGDRRARTALAERMYDRVRATVRYLAGGHRDQEDWVQVTLAEILRSTGSFRGESSLETWANRIAVRKTLRLLRKQQRRDRLVEIGDDVVPQPEPRLGEDQRYFVRRQLSFILASLPVKYRTVLVLRLVHEYSPDEIAEIVGAPLNTVRQRLRRGRARLMEKAANDPVFADWVRSRRR